MMTARVVGVVAVVCAAGGFAAAGVLSDGNFDTLAVGTAPNIGTPAGVWGFPQNYVQVGLGESEATEIQIVRTSSFSAGAKGNSLQTKVNSAQNVHVVAKFDQPITQKAGELIVVKFNVWSESFNTSGGTWGAGSVYLSGDHGGGGFDSLKDRGPQITWDQARRITVKSTLPSGGAESYILENNYPVDAWQSVRLEVDLNTDTFDVFVGPKDGPLSLIGDNLYFRSGPTDSFDRINIAKFTDFNKFTDGYFDDISVDVVPGPSGILTIVGGALPSLARRRR